MATNYNGANSMDYAKLSSLNNRAQVSAYIQSLETENDGALVVARAALADVENTPFNIGFIGHSMVEGYSSTKTMERFADSTITALRRKTGVTGGLGYKKAVKGFAGADWPIVNTGTVLGVADLGFGSNAGIHIGTGFITAQTISVPAGTTSVDIVWGREAGAGSFFWALDGGATTSVSTAGTVHRWQTTRITTNPATSHSIVLTPNTGFSRIGGAIFYAEDENKGIRGFEGGLPSNTTTMMRANYTGANANWLDAITVLQPQLIVLMAMCNDYMTVDQNPGTNRVSTTIMKDNLKFMTDAIAAKCTVRPSFILAIENHRNNIDAQIYPEKWASYIEAGYSLAEAEGWAVFDWGSRIGNVPGTPSAAAGLIHTDGIHPSTKGQRNIGEGLATFIAPS